MTIDCEAQAAQVGYLQRTVRALAGLTFDELADIANGLFRLETWELCKECDGGGCERCGGVGAFRWPSEYTGCCNACGGVMFGVPGSAASCDECGRQYSPAEWLEVLRDSNMRFYDEQEAGLWPQSATSPLAVARPGRRRQS